MEQTFAGTDSFCSIPDLFNDRGRERLFNVFYISIFLLKKCTSVTLAQAGADDDINYWKNGENRMTLSRFLETTGRDAIAKENIITTIEALSIVATTGKAGNGGRSVSGKFTEPILPNKTIVSEMVSLLNIIISLVTILLQICMLKKEDLVPR